MRRQRTLDEKSYLNALGTTIARLRNKKGLTQIQLSDKINSNQSTIWRYESGYTMPDILMLRKIAIALEVPLQDIFEHADHLLQKR